MMYAFGILREKSLIRCNQATDERKPALTAMGAAGKNKVGTQFCISCKYFRPVTQHNAILSIFPHGFQFGLRNSLPNGSIPFHKITIYNPDQIYRCSPLVRRTLLSSIIAYQAVRSNKSDRRIR